MTTSPNTNTLLVEREGSVLRIWLDRPESRNALSADTVDALGNVLAALHEDRSVRSIVLRGKGGTFCAGGDIKGFGNSMQHEMAAAEVAAANRRFGDLLIRLNEQPQVVIVLVEGAAIGGGLGLACAGDVTIVTRDARFRLSETGLGIPPAQIAPFVTDRIGLTAARRLMLTGREVPGDEAVGLGLAHILAENAGDLDVKCAQVLAEISRAAPGAIAATKAIMFEATRRPRADALDFAAERFADCLLGDEGREGIAAFVAKRRPRWARDDP